VRTLNRSGLSLRQIAGYLVLFTFLAFFFSIGPYFLAYRNSPEPLNFWIHFHGYGIRYIPWGFLVPIVITMARRFSLIGKDWPYNAVVHLASSIGLTFAHLAFAVLVNRALLAAGLRDLPVISYPQFAASHLNQNLLMYWLILAIVINIDSYRKYRDREIHGLELETELAKAQLHTLKAQIEPHFLFNTLHAVSGLVYRNPKEADALLARLGRLIRSNMELSEGQEIPLERELEILSAYTEIMTYRFGDRLQIETDIAPETRRALAPSFLLQPLVENAIRHGIGPKTQGGTVRITSRRENDELVVKIADDGVGFAFAPEGSGVEGVGLSNTRKRLDLIYGPRQTFAITNRPEGGAEVTIALPYREQLEDTSAGGLG